MYSSASIRRIKGEVKGLKQYSPEIQIINPLQLDVLDQNFKIISLIHGPVNSPYQGFSFRLQLVPVPQYPFKPPKFRFLDIPWNPYVQFKTGKICCDILINQWCPALTFRTAILSIVSLISETKINQDQPGLNIDAATEMRLKYSVFFENAKKMAEKNHYKKQKPISDIMRPSFQMPEDVANDDISFMEKKDKYINDPKVKKEYEKKKEFFNEHLQKNYYAKEQE